MNRHEIQINPSLCIGCGQCAKDCPTSNIQLKDKKAEILEAECIMCGHCAAICPKKAVTISGYSEAAVEQASSVRLDPQKVLEVIRFRRTIRQFQETEIPAEVISQILEAGRLTHTAENKQDVTYIVIDKEKASLEQQAVKFFRRLKPVANLFSSMARRTVIDDHFFFFQAPVAIVIAAKEDINGALAAQNMEFVAEANGLGVLYSGFFTMVVNHSRSLRAALHIPKGKKRSQRWFWGILRYDIREVHSGIQPISAICREGLSWIRNVRSALRISPAAFIHVKRHSLPLVMKQGRSFC